MVPNQDIVPCPSALQQQTCLKAHRIHLVTCRERFWKEFGSVSSFCNHLTQEVGASLRDEPVEEMFDHKPQEDVNTVDVDNNCFKPDGVLKLQRKDAA